MHIEEMNKSEYLFQPVNLISWGAKLEIASFDQGAIVNFIKVPRGRIEK